MPDKEKIIGFIKNKKNMPFILIIVISAAVIIGINFMSSSAGKKEAVQNSDDEFSITQYIRDNEARMEEMLSSVDGAGACRVTLTISQGPENVYASENKTSTDTKSGGDSNNTNAKEDSEDKVIIMRDKNGGEKALVQKTIAPKITGAVIICEGAADDEIRERVINAASIALDIKSNKVCVIKKSMD